MNDEGPWWPNRRIPPGSSPRPQVLDPEPTGSSGSLTFDSSNVTESTLEAVVNTARAVCGVDYLRPEACVVTLGVQRRQGYSQGLTQITQLDCMAGQNALPGEASTTNGYVVITYGVGASKQRALIDLKAGSFQLPPSSQVRVEAAAWFNSGNIIEPVVVNAAITRGHFGKRRATQTAFYTLTAATPETSLVPDNVCDVDCWAYVEALGVGKPVLSMFGANGFPSLVRDYSLGIWAPPYPAACFGTNAEFTATIISTVTCSAWVQYGIEF